MNEEIRFKGATTELLTPFLADGKIDYSSLEKELEFQLEEGINGLFVNGLASECLVLSIDERVTVLKAIVKMVNGRVPIMANIATNSITSAMEMLNEYEQAGADAIAITQPMVYAYTKDALYKYYSKLITSTKLPIYIYNAPESSNVLSPDLVAKLINENNNVQGYKDSTKNVIHLQTLMSLIKNKEHFEFIAGSDATTLPTLLLGGVGVISLLSTVFPRLIKELCDAYFEGNIEEAKKLQFRINKIRGILKHAPAPAAGYKYALSLKLTGYHEGYFRLPLVGSNENQRKYIKENLEKIGLL